MGKEPESKIKRRKEILKTPIAMLPDAPNNINLSKTEFVANRRKEKEDAVEKEKVWADHKAAKETKRTKKVD